MMTNKYPWIFITENNDVWKIYLNDNAELMYKIMHQKQKWTEEKIIDIGIIEFAICIEDGIIHILYVNKKNELKYCTRKEDKWIGEKVYDIKKDNFQVQELKAIILQGKMHVFYLLAAVDGSKRGILKHCVWDGRDIKLYTIQYIILSDKVDRYYEIQLEKKNCIDVFFVSNRGDEVSLSYCMYNQNSWTEAKRLYGIQGDNIMFKVLNTGYAFNIINKSREGSIYSLEHVRIEENVNIRKHEIYKGSVDPVEPIIFYINNKILTCWNEESNILCSEYNFGKWERPAKFNKKLKAPIRSYNFLNMGNIIGTYITYGTEDEDLYILSFEELADNKTPKVEEEKSEDDSIIASDDRSIEEIKDKFRRICYENSLLKEKIDSFSTNMKKKKFIVQEYENKINRILEEKKKLKEHCNFFMEVKQNIQGELDETKNELEKQKMFNNNMKNNLNKKEKDNKMLKEEIERLIDENNRLKQELEFERSQSLMTKLFRKKE
ncbi:hypothetical protein ACJDU8_03265 [Clostridium sp. WILCCON 0269]|uniref:Uncharacterized protein n=1 Tax=Candidatus Clostridium eludens TaxID=3381663 RepID=A0ABW8SFI9_9CLOT